MNRRSLLAGITAGGTGLAAFLLSRGQPASAAETTFPPVEISREEWNTLLEPARFRILFEEGTESAFSSPLDKFYEAGTYICAACFLPLFDAEHKYDSGTGWPSFTQPIQGRMGTKRDYKLIIPRTEYHCIRCGGHQGHVFNDGPRPTGQRWCNNGLALLFVAAGEQFPALKTSA